MLLGPVLLSALVATFVAPSEARPIAAVRGGGAAPQAWVTWAQGALWVCWERHPACFVRVELELADDRATPLLPAELRLGFADRHTLVIGTVEGPAFLLQRGQRGLQAIADRSGPGPALAAELEPLRPIACSDDGPVPAWTRSGLRWVPRPCGAPGRPCLARTGGSARRRAVGRVAGLRLGLFVEAGRAEAIDLVAVRSGSEGRAWVLAGLAVGFDPGRLRAARRGSEAAWVRAAPRLRTLPAVVPGPLAGAEARALTAILCAAEAVVR